MGPRTPHTPGSGGGFAPLRRPLLVLDGRDRVVGSSLRPGSRARGRRCWEVMGCGAATAATCPAVRLPATDGGRAADARSAGAPGGDAPCVRMALPLPRRRTILWGDRPAEPADPVGALSLLAALAAALIAERPRHGLEAALSLIRHALEADDCAVFLANGEGSELVLSACVGADRRALWRRVRLSPGEGFPGRAYAGERPVLSGRLNRELARGVRSLLSVPLPGPGGRPVGCLELAWRRGGLPLRRLAEELGWLAGPLGNAVAASYWAARQRMAAVLAPPAPAPRHRMQRVLDTLRQAAGADAGALVVWERGGEPGAARLTCGAGPPDCRRLDAPPASPCAPWFRQEAARSQHLGADTSHRPPCGRCGPPEGTLCLGLPAPGAVQGRVLLGFAGAPGGPPAPPIVPLLEMLDEAAPHLRVPAPAPAAADAPPPASLEIRCLGAFEVRVRGRPVPPSRFRRRGARTLLRILALRAGQPVHREQLIERLWPDAPPQAGLNRLHGVVHALRRAIEPDADGGPWRFVRSEGETYRLAAGPAVTVDVQRFREHMERARGRDDAHALEHLQQAVALYRGELFADEPYAEWCEPERARLARGYLDALEAMARAYVHNGRASHGVACLRSALERDPYREDLHHALISLLLTLRRPGEARQQVEACLAVLREDLAVAPSPDIERLARLLGVSLASAG